jgi:hypothetical protein
MENTIPAITTIPNKNPIFTITMTKVTNATDKTACIF